MLSFSLKESRQVNPLQVPQWGLYGEKYLVTGHFYLSLNISIFIFPSESPVRKPPKFPNRVPKGSNTPSPEPLVYFSSIHSCMSVGVPKKEPSYIHMEKNIRSPSTEPHADGRPTYSGVRPGSPRGSLRHCYLYPSAMQSSARYLPLACVCRGNPHQGIPPTTVTASHATQGRAEYESMIP